MFKCVLLVGLFSASSAYAATRTYEADVQNIIADPGMFLALGIAPTTSGVMKLQFDDSVPAFHESAYAGPEKSYQRASWHYTSFSFEIGGRTIAAAPPGISDKFTVSDGIADGSENALDFFTAKSFAYQDLGGGLMFKDMYFFLNDPDESKFSGTGLPSIDALNSLSERVFYLNTRYFTDVGEKDLSLRSYVLDFVEVPAPVPLPAGLPLVVTGVAGFAMFRFRRKSK
jgi:hypothetical protein